jgi:small subunit ribosomal protein S12
MLIRQFFKNKKKKLIIIRAKSTTVQLIRRKKRRLYVRRPLLRNRPHRKGICMKILERSPKKPNSARRKVAKVFVLNLKRSTQIQTFAYIPGERAKLREHAVVLIRGGRTKDLPGLKYKLIRGKYDFDIDQQRRKKRSKYGVPLNRTERLDGTNYIRKHRLKNKN